MARNFVGDGFDLPGTIDPIPGLYSGAKFMYRPATGVASDLIQMAFTPEARFAAKAKLVHDNLVAGSFAFLNDDGTPTPKELTLEEIKTLHRGQFDTLLNYVLGNVAPNVGAEGNE